ncbi:hypothetical protein WJX74_004431 [Apatococcus lobatus]|uniref:Tocopherol cyclase n=2 Tax=Apatococcus TaxID=904362 RepID=A0AAW1TBG1_9CHLO
MSRARSTNAPDQPRIGAVTPHSGYHYDGSKRRFFEGWYFNVNMGKPGETFALIFSAEDPSGDRLSGMGVQVMGPGDTYLLHHELNIDTFWADKRSLALGACFKAAAGKSSSTLKQMVSQGDFERDVELGFQSCLTLHQGSIVAKEDGAQGNLPSAVPNAKWCFTVQPVYGWGDSGGKQKSTAGWLAALPVFEPHWQIILSHGLATGYLEWGGKRYDFKDAPSYSEKNWGLGFPKRWFWVQCNTFNDPDVALTAVGARRGVLNLPGVEENVGLIGVHWKGKFLELVPWNGEIKWEVSPWGSWHISARGKTHEAVVHATAEDDSGTALRAPTIDNGLTPFCRDSFYGKVHLQVWELDTSGKRKAGTVLDVHSESGAVEIGGGGWNSVWKAQAEMKEPLRSAVNLPIDVEALTSFGPIDLRPSGL